MRTLVALALFLLIGFIGARGYVRRATHRLPFARFFATGTEFLVLGVILGPHGLGLIDKAVIADIEPVVYLALGWIGMLVGIELSAGHLAQISRRVFRFLAVDALLITALFSTISFLLLKVLRPEWAPRDAAVVATIFGITASVASPAVIAIAAGRVRARGPFVNTMKITGSLSALFPLLAFGILFIAVHPRFFDISGIGYGALWWLSINVIGLTLGFLMVLFTQERASDNEMLLVIMGTLMLVGGLSYYLDLSALYTATVMGAVVGNFSKRRDQVFRELHVVEKTLFVGLLVIVGVSISVPGRAAILAILAYVAVRLLLRLLVTGRVMQALLPEAAPVGWRAGLALSGQSVIAVAIGLDFLLASNEIERPALQFSLTVVALVMILTEALGLPLTRIALETHAGKGRKK